MLAGLEQEGKEKGRKQPYQILRKDRRDKKERDNNLTLIGPVGRTLREDKGRGGV